MVKFTQALFIELRFNKHLAGKGQGSQKRIRTLTQWLSNNVEPVQKQVN